MIRDPSNMADITNDVVEVSDSGASVTGVNI
jgi:hypothetical protein